VGIPADADERLAPCGDAVVFHLLHHAGLIGGSDEEVVVGIDGEALRLKPAGADDGLGVGSVGLKPLLDDAVVGLLGHKEIATAIAARPARPAR
jgi:hypothetical protein